jgi:hypothetical protein
VGSVGMMEITGKSIRDRIVELRRVAARELVPNPKNWRRHPARQAAALRGALEGQDRESQAAQPVRRFSRWPGRRRLKNPSGGGMLWFGEGNDRLRSEGCPFSKLGPRRFVGSFDRPRIACVHGDAGKRSIPGRPKRIPNPHRADGELLKLGFAVSQTTLSRPCHHQADGRHSRGGPSSTIKPSPSATTSIWRSSPTGSTRACMFGLIGGRLVQFAAAQVATVCAGFSRCFGYQLSTLNAQRICLSSGRRDRGAMHRAPWACRSRPVFSIPGLESCSARLSRAPRGL